MNCNQRGMWELTPSYQKVQRECSKWFKPDHKNHNFFFFFAFKKILCTQKEKVDLGKYLKFNDGQNCCSTSQFLFHMRSSDHLVPVPYNYAIFLIRRWQDQLLSCFWVGRQICADPCLLSRSPPMTNAHISELAVLEKTKLDEQSGR